LTAGSPYKAGRGPRSTAFRRKTFITTTRWRGWLKILTLISSTSLCCRRAVGRRAETVKSVGFENLVIALRRRCAGRRHPVLFPSSQSATKQSATFGRGRRSSSFACPWRSPSGLETIPPGRYRPESVGTAKQVGSCCGGLDRYRPEPVPSRAVCRRSRQANLSSLRSAPAGIVTLGKNSRIPSRFGSATSVLRY
jgi:hypothetical protein